jgi:hypothetical protein
MQSIPVLTLTVRAAAALQAARFVTHAGAVPSAGARVIGVTRSSAEAGDEVAVDVLGTTIVEAGAAISSVGALLETDAQGRAVPKTTGTAVAVALQTATAAGQKIEALLLPN